MDKHQTAKLIGYAFAGIIACYFILALLPYIKLFLALCGAWYLFQEFNSKRGRF